MDIWLPMLRRIYEVAEEYGITVVYVKRGTHVI